MALNKQSFLFFIWYIKNQCVYFANRKNEAKMYGK